MITIKGYQTKNGFLKNLIFDCIEINIVKVLDGGGNIIFLVGNTIEGFKYHIHIYHRWMFMKLITKKFLYKLLDRKTIDDLFRQEHIILFYEHEDNFFKLLDGVDYIVLRKQIIKL